MRTIDRYILKLFLQKFVSSFVVIYFIFLIQTFWLYFDELAGKGLGLFVILKFLIYFSPIIILQSLPLSILLGGIMSFGGLSERSEFAAIKSMGVSLVKSMKYLIVFIILLAVGTFIFANTALPYGNYKFGNLRRNIGKKMPSAAIKQGVFNSLEGFNIHVEEKYGKDNNKLRDIVIHQKVKGIPDKLVIAKTGIFKSDPDNQIVQLLLFDGGFYEDLARQQKKASDRRKFPAMKTTFKEHLINIDISDLNDVDLDNTSISSAYQMLNVIDLKKEIDTLQRERDNNYSLLSSEIIKRNNIKNISGEAKKRKYKDVYALLSDSAVIDNSGVHSVYSRAVSKADAMIMLAKRKLNFFQSHTVKQNKYVHAFYEKFAYPIVVIIMFFVGIPLGAIIKKGGFGISMVFGIVIFLVYYILSMLGKNAAEEGGIPPYLGAWLSTLVLLPLGIFLTYTANRDYEFISMSTITAFFKSLFQKNRLEN